MDNDKFELSDGTIWLCQDIKKSLQEVYDHYRSVELRNEYLLEENKRLKDEAYRSEELAKMKKEYDRMQADYYRGFPISEKQEKKISEWMDSLPKANTGAIGGRFHYEFFPTSIGTAGTIVDSVTGQKFTFQELG